MAAPMLSDVRIHVRFKLSALWVAVMLCYIYGDLFGFFQQKTVSAIVAGNAGMIGTQTGLLAAASMMAVPSVMVFLSLVLPPRVSRWINVVLGLAFTGIIIATMPGSWMFYKLLGVVEAALTLTIVWYALRWPGQEPREPLI